VCEVLISNTSTTKKKGEKERDRDKRRNEERKEGRKETTNSGSHLYY
jgi:hypothetical protein